MRKTTSLCQKQRIADEIAHRGRCVLCLSQSSGCMMPALLRSAFNVGYSRAICCATRAMCVLEVLAQNGMLRFTRVEYSLTELGTSLCAAFCGVWQWAEKHEPELRALRMKRDGGG